jgi:predicted DNA-binding transcriptional regulator YafY
VSRRPKNPGTRRVTKAERWLNLLAFLLDRHYPVSREEILNEVDDYREDWKTGDKKIRESVRRKFERDKSELKALGVAIEPRSQKIQVEHTSGEVEAYLLQPRDFYLPYLELASETGRGKRPYHLPSVSVTAEELTVLRRAAERVLALGETSLAPSAASALRKLSFDIPSMATVEGETVTTPVSAEFQKVFAELRSGIENRRRVLCRYYSIGRDQEEDRELEPYALMLTWGHWYCIGRSGDAIRVFRLSRMRRAQVSTGSDNDFQVPRNFSVRKYLDRAPWELSEAPAVAVRIRLAFPHSRWVLAEGLGRVIKALDSGAGAVLEFDVRSTDPFIRWLLPFGTQAEVLAPAALAAQLESERNRIRALYS